MNAINARWASSPAPACPTRRLCVVVVLDDTQELRLQGAKLLILERSTIGMVVALQCVQ